MVGRLCTLWLFRDLTTALSHDVSEGLSRPLHRAGHRCFLSSGCDANREVGIRPQPVPKVTSDRWWRFGDRSMPRCYTRLMEWRSPGRAGSALYLVVALLLGSLTTVLTRLSIARRRAHRRIATRLPDGPIIIIANHTSYADGLLLTVACRRLGRSIRLLATSGVFRAPMLGRLVVRLGFIRVDRGTSSAAASLDVAESALRAGEAVAIFPEGRTTRDPDRWPERAKTGAVRLALRSGAPIIPVAMVGTHRILTRDRLLRSLLVSIVLRPRVLVEVGDPIDVRAETDQEEPNGEEVRRLADLVMARLIHLIGDVRGERAPSPAGVDPSIGSDRAATE